MAASGNTLSGINCASGYYQYVSGSTSASSANSLCVACPTGWATCASGTVGTSLNLLTLTCSSGYYLI